MSRMAFARPWKWLVVFAWTQLFMHAAFAGWTHLSLPSMGEEQMGQLIYTAKPAQGNLRQTVTLALPSPVLPDLKWVQWTDAQGHLHREGGQQIGGCKPHWGMPERFRDTYVISLQGVECLDAVQMIWEYRFAGRVDGARSLPSELNSAHEKILQNWVLNYPESRTFRSQPQPSLGKASASISNHSNNSNQSNLWGAQLPVHRLAVFTRQAGIHVLTYAALKAAGVPMNQLRAKQLQLWHAGSQVPIYVAGEADGTFDIGDEIEFLGEPSRGEISYYSPYTTESAYFLTWDNTLPGLRAPQSAVPTRLTAKKNPSTYHVDWHSESDRVVLRAFSTAEENITDLGDRVQEEKLSEFWFWERQRADRDQITIPFEIPYSPAVSGIGETDQSHVVVRVQLKGITNDIKADPDHHVRFLLNGKDISLVNGKANDAIWEGQSSITWVSVSLPLGILKPGINELTLQKVNDLKTSDGKSLELQDAYLNWIEVSFPARFSAMEGQSHFSNRFRDSLGLRLFEVSGFQSDSIAIWDTRGRRLQGAELRREANGLTLRFADSLVSLVEYRASDYAKRALPRLQLDTLPDFLRPNQGADWICITESPLLGSALDSLVKQRQSQGLRTTVVLSHHLYQAFGNGTTDPLAIRNFLQYAYEHWPRPAPTYVLLLGETSLWYDKLPEANSINLVPTRLIDIRGWGVSANDDYYGKVTGADEIPDLLVGRIPVSKKSELSSVVAKMLRLEKERNAGEWLNRSLLIGGYEVSFTEANREFQKTSLGLGRHTERIDLFPQSPYYRPPQTRRDFFSKLDSAFSFVQFFGHGGGSVWSDAGILTLQALDKDSLKGDWAIPLISSVTCLTGYFEDPLDRSLGEEMLRRPRNGAAAFYGSSGYISSAAGAVIGDAMAQFALAGGHSTVGAIITQAEWLVRQKTGSAFLPILAEFNLLGDPAMPLYTPEVKTGLAITPSLIRGQTELQITGQTQSIRTGEAVLQITLQDSVLTTVKGQVQDSKWNQTLAVSSSATGFSGHGVLHVFADTTSEVWMGRLAAGDWWVDSVEFIPKQAAYGDSIRVQLHLRTLDDSAEFENGVLLLALGDEKEPDFQNGDQRLLVEKSKNLLEIATPWVIPNPEVGDSPLPQLYVKARMGLRTLDIVETSPHRMALTARPRLSLRPQGVTFTLQDSVGITVHFQNLGPGIARNTQVQVTSSNGDSVWKFVRGYSKELPFGAADSVWIPLPDSILATPLHINLIPEFGYDALAQALSLDTNFQWWTRRLQPDEKWQPQGSNGIELLAQTGNDRSVRAYVKAIPFSALPSHLSWPDTAKQGFEYQISLAENSNSKSKLQMNLPQATSGNWHWMPAGASQWIRIDSNLTQQSDYVGPGGYALVVNQDANKPLVSFQSRGQNLWPDDYVPLHTPIDIILQDGQGIDLIHRRPHLQSHGQTVDSLHLSQDAAIATPTLARMRFMPVEGAMGSDTLNLVATDISGNVTRQSFVYRLGNRLSIQNLGSYPNPFADTATFVYTLTDYCEKVRLQVFSRAGRKVRTLTDERAVGYREVVWDGKTDAGADIANGLYFLKVTARSADRTETRIFKLFKKRRR